MKKILIAVLLAATPIAVLSSQETQAPAEPQHAPATGPSASSSHHAIRHHRHGKNSHHRAHRHHSTKQHTQPQ